MCGCAKRAKKTLKLADSNDTSAMAIAARAALNPKNRITRRIRRHVEKVASETHNHNGGDDGQPND
jgi:hypothetical protein